MTPNPADDSAALDSDEFISAFTATLNDLQEDRKPETPPGEGSTSWAMGVAAALELCRDIMRGRC